MGRVLPIGIAGVHYEGPLGRLLAGRQPPESQILRKGVGNTRNQKQEDRQDPRQQSLTGPLCPVLSAIGRLTSSHRLSPTSPLQPEGASDGRCLPGV